MAKVASAFREGSVAASGAIAEPAATRRIAKSGQAKSLEELASGTSGERGVSLELAGLSKQFGGKVVLNDLHLSIEKGQFVAIVGRSGCGKSTLLRLIAGLDAASGGTLHRQGQPVNGINSDTRFMFQDARLLPWLSVLDNIKLGLTGGKQTSLEKKANAALQLVGLEGRGKDWPSVLSGGQRQRVALARALVGNPRLLLFDEPLGALDALTRIEMQNLIEHLWQQRGFTAILVTHDVSEAVAMADRVILLEEGRVALDLPITLARPRIRDSGFAHFEKVILDRVMKPVQHAESTVGDFDI